MTWSTALPWVAALAVLVLVGLLLRYRTLARSGTGLPPGVGGGRMVGTTGTVTGEHVPGTQRGTVHVLGEDWTVADVVVVPLDVGDTVTVERVVGTRLVVRETNDPGKG